MNRILKFLWFHKNVVFFSSLLFYLSPLLIAVLVTAEAVRSPLLWLSGIAIVLIRGSSWIKWRYKYPYYHPMLDGIKGFFLEEGMPVDVRIDNALKPAIYLQPWKNGYHDVRLSPSGEILRVAESEIWLDFASTKSCRICGTPILFYPRLQPSCCAHCRRKVSKKLNMPCEEINDR